MSHRALSPRLLLLGLLFGLSGCAYYSFSGATIPSHLNTIAIPLVEDNSVSTVTTLDEQMTRLLIDRFVGQTRLSLQQNEDEADAVLRVSISRYLNQETVIGGEERATRNRVSITVSVAYNDQAQDTELLNQTFSSFEEYDPFDPERGLAGEEDAASAALEKIADDIFTAATSNW